MTLDAGVSPSGDSRGVGLRRGFGPLDGAAIIVSNVIGSGIFIVPIFVAQAVPNPIAILSVWFIGGVLAFAGAMAYAELASLRPRAGGEYVYLHEAFGPVVGFLTGWTSFVAGFSGAIAAGAVGFVIYLERFFFTARDTEPILSLSLGLVTLSISSQSIIALMVIAVFTVVHIVGIGPGGLVQNFLATLKVVLLMAFVVLGFSFGQGTGHNFVDSGGPVTMSTLLLALIPVMFSYSGWNAATYVAEEIRDPSRNIPLAMGIGTALVVTIYLLLNLLYLYALPVSTLATVETRVVDAVAGQLFGPVVAAPLAIASAAMIAASVSAMVLAGPRVYYAMAQNGQFFSAMARIHPRYRTPTIAIIAQSLWASVLVLTGTFEQLVQYTGFAVVLFSGVAVSAVFVLRHRDPRAHRPFKAWGYPVAPLVFVSASFMMVVNAIFRSPVTSLAGVAIIAAGVPVYFAVWKKSMLRKS